MGAWARAAGIPAVGPLAPAPTLLALASSFPCPETKSITTNFKCHTEVELTPALQRGCQFQARLERLFCIQGTDTANAKSQVWSHAL